LGLADRLVERCRFFQLLLGDSRIFSVDFSPRQRPICIRKWLKINDRNFWPFGAAMQLAAAGRRYAAFS